MKMESGCWKEPELKLYIYSCNFMEQKHNRVNVILPLLLAIMLGGGILLGINIRLRSDRSQYLIYPRTDKIGTVMSYILGEYVDTVNKEKLTEDAIRALLNDLDPHSVYIPASELQAVNEPLEGNFSGIGVQFNMQNDTVAIILTVANGPSERVGIRPGDRIIKINDTLVAGVKLGTDKIMKKLRGPRGTRVKVSIMRRGIPGLLDFEITRDQIPIYSVDAAYMLTPSTGYIKISSFSRTTHEEFVSSAEKLHKQGMKRIIIDLRGNGGGYMESATSVADEFLGDNEMIVFTQGRQRPRSIVKARPGGICVSDNVIVMIDEWSASASEILAGAIQDNDRGTIIGRRSFGKGLVQEQIPLPDGSALRLTVARYYTPTGRCIQKPYRDGTEAYYHELMDRYNRGELSKPDSALLPDSLKYRTPKGKVVYGGGGIMPDVFVPLDTSGVTSWFTQVRSKGLTYSFAFKYTDDHRQDLEKCQSVNALLDYLNKKDIFKDFLKFVSNQGIAPKQNEIAKSKLLADTEIKAYIARNIFDNEGFYRVILQIDETLKKALELPE